MNDAGGWLWLVIDVGLVTILAGAMIYGIAMWRKQRDQQTPQQQQRRDQVTEDLYQAEDRR